MLCSWGWDLCVTAAVQRGRALQRALAALNRPVPHPQPLSPAPGSSGWLCRVHRLVFSRKSQARSPIPGGLSDRLPPLGTEGSSTPFPAWRGHVFFTWANILPPGGATLLTHHPRSTSGKLSASSTFERKPCAGFRVDRRVQLIWLNTEELGQTGEACLICEELSNRLPKWPPRLPSLPAGRTVPDARRPRRHLLSAARAIGQVRSGARCCRKVSASGGFGGTERRLFLSDRREWDIPTLGVTGKCAKGPGPMQGEGWAVQPRPARVAGVRASGPGG